ncbi:flagellar assembly peptidoglycan hydrolase FlgJ [Pseudomonas sp. M30-35]|uniref:flagellar assembly peptidoglycan hydrolase FlgJ n=1 Tax=Pseudomonas sp. M30-35 TaxID=1981174 RepID=UPI000B3C56EB|nr:flagellar assembly peptidoglycan hydrolase FlgJ [Pseudomonas sp. M30-35]ARU89184.1 flagellar rod assembly protein/muramidase FlgJ [Pseudomonas sp. M30-35]
MDSRLSAGLASAGTSSLDGGAATDLNRLNKFKVGGDSEANIGKVAKEFESLFLNEMLKAMRSANEGFSEGNFMNSEEGKTYQGMYDQQLAVTMSNNKNGIGLADVLARQMSKMKSHSDRPNPFAHPDNAVTSASIGAPGAVAASSTDAVKPTAQVDSRRDDSSLINKRRLSLPGKLADRLLAGITPTTDTAAVQALANNDWIPAIAHAAPKDKGLSINGSDAISGARLAQKGGKGASEFTSPADFIATMLPMAEKAAEKIGVEARYLVAQAALETGWGKSIIRQQDGTVSHNLFGIKSHNSWSGESAKVMTTEYKGGQAVKEAASFRSYDSFAQSFEDYVSFLQTNGRYEKALGSTQNPEQFVKELQKAGYATDPQYARKISQIARKMAVYQTVASVDTTPTRG